MIWDEGDVFLDGVKIHYYRRGSGHPLVLAHGASDNGLCWTRVAAVLVRDHDVIAYDARFHGLSDGPENVQGGGGPDLVGLVEKLGLDRPAIMGHSMGAGSVAAAAAERPDLFRCAILEDPAWRMPADASVAPQSSPERPQMPDYRSMTIEEIMAAGRQRNPMWHEDEFRPWALSKKQFRRRNLEIMPGAASPGAWRQIIQKITCPILLVTGGNRERGAIVTPEAAEEVRRLCPTLEVVRFERAGHNIRREAFQEFVAAVTAFLAAYQVAS